MAQPGFVPTMRSHFYSDHFTRPFRPVARHRTAIRMASLICYAASWAGTRLSNSHLPGQESEALAGGPFTLASYLIEGGPSRDNYARLQALMYAEPALWSALLDALADFSLEFLRAQVAAGASAVQLFDSWVGSLSAAEYRDRVMPASAKVLGGLADLGAPRIHFGVGTGHLVELMAEAGADVVGVDWRLSLSDALRLVRPGKAVQGNLNPTACFAHGRCWPPKPPRS